ncbi:MAG: hypothetical protein ACTSPA_03315 [Promethearchaeota archaeon]
MRIFPLIFLVMTGLITMTNMTSPIAVTVENQRLQPFSSDVTLKDSILENQTLFYQIFSQQTLSQALCDSEIDEFESLKYYRKNVTQEISFDSNNELLKIQEKVGENEFEYNITSTSNIPEATLLNYSYRNGWQHNYPKENSEITLNTQEITNLIMNRENFLVSTYIFEKNEDLKYGDLTIPTQVFINSNSSSFVMTMGLG